MRVRKRYPHFVDPRLYSVSPLSKKPLVAFIVDALQACGCRIIHTPDPGSAPLRFTFEAPDGSRLGIMVYAFFANSKKTKNRPADEHRFQIKYSSDDKQEHEIWQDPYGLYITLFCGIDPERGIFIGADPVLHSPTRFFISLEYKEDHANLCAQSGWHVWERDRRAASEEPVEVLVGGTQTSFLRYIYFEREAMGEGQGHRQLLAEKPQIWTSFPVPEIIPAIIPETGHLHQLAKEFQLSVDEVLDLIASARRLKMAVRGWVAEEHLVRLLKRVEGVDNCERLDLEDKPDVLVSFRAVPLLIECKNVLRQRSAGGLARMDFQRTRASKNDPCSRYYGSEEFDVLAACLHAVDESWTFSFALPGRLDPHLKCPGKLSNNVRIDDRWSLDAAQVLETAAQKKN